MLNKTLTAVAIAATSLIAGIAAADPVYYIATVSVEDWDTYNADYMSVAAPGIINAGGEILVGAQGVTMVEGD